MPRAHQRPVTTGGPGREDTAAEYQLERQVGYSRPRTMRRQPKAPTRADRTARLLVAAGQVPLVNKLKVALTPLKGVARLVVELPIPLLEMEVRPQVVGIGARFPMLIRKATRMLPLTNKLRMARILHPS